MKKNIFIHIGDMKTGSTTIQDFFTSNREILLKNNILYPKSALLASHGIAHHKLAICLQSNSAHFLYKNEKDCQNVIEELLSEIEATSCQNIIISTEMFSVLKSYEEIKRLKDLFLSYNVKIVAYVRRPDKWIESMYKQDIKYIPFTSQTFTEYLESKKVEDSILFTIVKYYKIFGKESILIRSFEKNRFYNYDLIDDFFHTIKLKKIGQNVKSTNESPNIYLTEIFRRLNLSIKMKQNKRLRLYEALMKSFRLTYQNHYLTTVERIEYLKKYAIIIERINNEFLDGSNLFSKIETPSFEDKVNEIATQNIEINIDDFIKSIKSVLNENI